MAERALSTMDRDNHIRVHPGVVTGRRPTAALGTGIPNKVRSSMSAMGCSAITMTIQTADGQVVVSDYLLNTGITGFNIDSPR